MLDKDKKYVVYQGSIYRTGEDIPNELWVMEETEWNHYHQHALPQRSAKLLARGLTREIALKMIDMTKET